MNLLNNFSKEESARRVHNIGCCHSASHQFTNHNSRQFRDDAYPSGVRSVPHEIETEIEELFKKGKDVCFICGYVSANEFFSFPSDVDTRQQWATFCDLAFDMVKPHFRLCDRHFKPHDYRISIQRKLLIPTSVPTLQPNVKYGCAPSINNSLQSSLNSNNIFNPTLDKNTSKNAIYSPIFQSNTTTVASNKQFRRNFRDIASNYDDDVPPKAKKLALKRKLKVKQSQQQTKCFRSEIFRLRTRCSSLEDSIAELRKRIERLDEKCFESDKRRLTIYSSEKPEESSHITEAHFVDTAVNGVSLTTLLPKKSSDDPRNTMTQLSRQHSEKNATASTEIAESITEVTCNSNLTTFSEVECSDVLSNVYASWLKDHSKKAADEDGYSTDSSMPPLEISSDELHTSEEPLEKFSKEGGSRYSAQASLVEFIEKVTEDYRSAGSFILPPETSRYSQHNSEEQLEQFPDEVALVVETAQNIIEDVGNTNLSIFLREKSNDSRDTDTTPEQYSEGEAYVEHVDEDDQFPNLTAVSPQKLSDNSPCNAEAQSQQRSEEVDLASEDLRNCFSDPMKATDYVFFNVVLDDNEVVTGISPQINHQLRRNDTATNLNNEQFDKAHVGQKLRMEQVQVTTQQPNCNDELNVCQRNGQASPSAGCSKRRKNGDECRRITRSAKKKKELPSVDTSIQITADTAPKKVKRVLTRDSPPYRCNICDKTFSKKRYCMRHQRDHVKLLRCQKCEKSFARKSNLIQHEATHSEKRPYECGFCDSRFKHNRNKLQHERYMHTEVACFECAVCGKKFNFRESIIQHVRVHSGQKPFRCRTCDTRFSFKDQLVVHERAHSKEKKFKCRICKRLFKFQCSKITHERSHAEGPRFECAVCGKKYRQKRGLANHISSNCS
ncbi:zinc finger protein with KRAB and SCAN domains 3-like isoform X3 [Planococcus citri]|uniref:zinc finger protein with KRAB and SCAN domains 3-like isoform X3 n=1 Tax=Planococcus citri TaxID=170843 RepID=UPI0031F9A62E